MSSRDRMMKLVLVSLIVILVLVLIVVNMKLREKSRIIQLNESKKQISDLQSKIEGLTNYISESSGAEYIKANHEEFEKSITEMRSKYMTLIDDKALVDSMSDFKSTEGYKKLIDKVEHNNVIEQGDWSVLENEVQAKSPRFIKNLHFLSRGKLNESEIKTCVLIKIGMTPTQLAKLLSLEKGTISSRREGIGVKIIGEKTPVSKVDKFIRLL